MKYALAILALIGLSACHRPESSEQVGRFQMVATNNAEHEVYVLDTQYGDIWACSGERSLPLSVACGPLKGRPR
jgi:hypothetical protein